jgi:hypothetical protein
MTTKAAGSLPGQQSSTVERRAWVSDWASHNPGASVSEARSAVRERFGVSLGTAILNDVMKGARVTAGIPPARRSSAPNDIATLVQRLHSLGVRKLEMDDARYRAEVILVGKVAY